MTPEEVLATIEKNALDRCREAGPHIGETQPCLCHMREAILAWERKARPVDVETLDALEAEVAARAISVEVRVQPGASESAVDSAVKRGLAPALGALIERLRGQIAPPKCHAGRTFFDGVDTRCWSCHRITRIGAAA
ncbi:MAG: hypothetical protein LC798_16910 [Chloroflexi bacterium]|nr:hypothetical protein [Chloroflexota bacterium]